MILLHTLADGSSHFDWLSESAGAPRPSPARDSPDAATADERSLIAFRASQSVAALQPGQSLLVDQLPNHRRLYLDYEGPISGDRGSVTRIGTGVIEHATAAADGRGSRLLIRWHRAEKADGGVQSLEMRLLAESRWLARCETGVAAAE